MADQGGWSGAAKPLLTKLIELVAEDVRRTADWPKGAAQLSSRLRRIAPTLRQQGIRVDLDAGRDPKYRTRLIRIEKMEKQRSQDLDRSEESDMIEPAPPTCLEPDPGGVGAGTRKGPALNALYTYAGQVLPNADDCIGARTNAAEGLDVNGANAANAVFADDSEWVEEL